MSVPAGHHCPPPSSHNRHASTLPLHPWPACSDAPLTHLKVSMSQVIEAIFGKADAFTKDPTKSSSDGPKPTWGPCFASGINRKIVSVQRRRGRREGQELGHPLPDSRCRLVEDSTWPPQHCNLFLLAIAQCVQRVHAVSFGTGPIVLTHQLTARQEARVGPVQDLTVHLSWRM